MIIVLKIIIKIINNLDTNKEQIKSKQAVNIPYKKTINKQLI